MRILLAMVFIAACMVTAGCMGTSGSAKPLHDHGGYTGQAAHYYDFGFKTCRQQTTNYLAKGKNPASLNFMTLAPDKYKKAAENGCGAGKESATAMGTCTPNTALPPGTTSELDCTYPGTSQP